MTKHKVWLVFLILPLLLPMTNGCGEKIKTPGVPSAYQQIVDDMNSIKPVSGDPGFNGGDTTSDLPADKWDINTFFRVLTRLSMEEGYVLDWVYVFDLNGGFPTIYTRPVGQAPFKNYREYRAYTGTPPGNKLIIEDTAEGYFEYILFCLEGNDFFVFWHSIVGYRHVICDKTALKGVYLKEDALKEAQKLDLLPRIEIKDTTAVVSVVTFNGWKGFVRETYTIDREHPENILNRDFKTIMPYNSGITP